MDMTLIDDGKIELEKQDEIMCLGSKKKAKIADEDYEIWV